MELGEYLGALRRRWLVIALLGAVGAAAGWFQATSTPPTYRSTSSVIISLTRGDTVSELSQGATYTQNLVASFVQVATMPIVLDPVIEELGLDTTARRLASSVQADSPLDTQIIEIAAVSQSPQRAADIANSVVKHLGEALPKVSPQSGDGVPSLKMVVGAPAQAPSRPFAPRPTLTAAMGGAAGLGLGVLLALGLAQLDTRVRTTADLPTAPSRTTLGQVPFDRSLSRRSLAVLDDPHSPLAESYRRVRTNLQFLDASRRLRSFVVTSSIPGEGKSTTSVNLALVMAEKGLRVLLVDADLRSPSVADICGLEGGAGLSAVLISEASLDDVVQPWGVPGLHVLTAGQIPPNPSQLIDSDAMGAFLREAGSLYDLVILDTAPLVAVTDAAVLAHRTDGAVVVVRSRMVKRPDLVEALGSLDAVGAVCLGLLVNGAVRRRKELRYGYGHQPVRRRTWFRRSARAGQAKRARRRAGVVHAHPEHDAPARAAGPFPAAAAPSPAAAVAAVREPTRAEVRAEEKVEKVVATPAPTTDPDRTVELPTQPAPPHVRANGQEETSDPSLEPAQGRPAVSD